MTPQNIITSAPDIPQRQLTGRLVVLLAGLAAIGMLATNIMLPSFPVMADALGIATRELGIILSSFFIAFALGQVVAGPLSDRFGRKPVVLGGIALFLIGTLICGLAPSLDIMIAGRVLQAFGACAGSVLARAISRDLFDGETLARVLSLTMIATAAAPGFSPLLGGLVSEAFGWRASFLLVGVLGAGLGIYFWRAMAESHPAERRAPAGLGDTFTAYARLAVNPLFFLPAIAGSLVMGALFATFAAAPVLLMAEIALLPIQYGLFSAATVFVVFGAGMLVPRLVQRFGAPASATGGAIFAILGGAVLLIAYRQPDLALYSTSLVMFLFGMGISSPLATAMTLGPFKEQAGLASALLGFLQMVCAAIGTGLATALPFSAATSIGVLEVTAGFIALCLFRLYVRYQSALCSTPKV